MQTWVFIYSRMLTPKIRDTLIPIAEPLGGGTSSHPQPPAACTPGSPPPNEEPVSQPSLMVLNSWFTSQTFAYGMPCT